MGFAGNYDDYNDVTEQEELIKWVESGWASSVLLWLLIQSSNTHTKCTHTHTHTHTPTHTHPPTHTHTHTHRVLKKQLSSKFRHLRFMDSQVKDVKVSSTACPPPPPPPPHLHSLHP